MKQSQSGLDGTGRTKTVSAHEATEVVDRFVETSHYTVIQLTISLTPTTTTSAFPRDNSYWP